MRTTGKQPVKPTPSTVPAIMLIEADPPEGDQDRDEEDISDTRDYQLGTKEFRDAAAGKLDERDAAPEAREARESRTDEINEQTPDHKVNAKPKPRARALRPSKDK